MGGIDPHTVCDVTAGAWEPAVTGVSGGNCKEKPAMGKPVFTMEGALHAKERQGESFVARTYLANFSGVYQWERSLGSDYVEPSSPWLGE